MQLESVGEHAVLGRGQRIRPLGVQRRMRRGHLHGGGVWPCPLRHHAVLRTYMDLEVHVGGPSWVPPRENGHEFAFPVGVGHLVPAAVGLPLRPHRRVAAVVSVAVAMPNVHANVGHRVAVVGPHDADFLPQRDANAVLSDVLTEKEGVLGQVQRKWPRGLRRHQHTIAPFRLGRGGPRPHGRKHKRRARGLQKLAAFHGDVLSQGTDPGRSALAHAVTTRTPPAAARCVLAQRCRGF